MDSYASEMLVCWLLAWVGWVAQLLRIWLEQVWERLA